MVGVKGRVSLFFGSDIIHYATGLTKPLCLLSRKMKTDFVALCRVYVSSQSWKKGRFRVCYRKIISLFHVSRQSYHSRFTNSISFLLRITENKFGRSRFTRNPLTAPLEWKASLIPWGLRVPIWKINFCSRVLRLSVLPWCRERPQTTISCLEWLGRLKCLATSLDAFLSSFSTLRRCSRNLSPSHLPVSPRYNFLQRVQVIQ